MSVSHVGGRPALPLVLQRQSAPKTQVGGDPGNTVLDKALLPDTRKVLPEQAKGAAHGLSVQKFFDKWDSDGDGKITAAEAGRRFGHGVLAELLKLQESGPSTPTDTGANPTSASGPTAADPTPV